MLLACWRPTSTTWCRITCCSAFSPGVCRLSIHASPRARCPRCWNATWALISAPTQRRETKNTYAANAADNYCLHYVCSSERCSQDFMTTRWGTQYITARSKVTDTTKHRTGKSRLHYSIWCNVSKMILCLKLVLIKQPSWERQCW